MIIKKKTLIIIIAAVFIIIGIAVFAVWGIQHYMDKNTWATVRVTGTAQSDTADAFEGDQECKKDDTLSFAGVRLRITDIRHDGTVTFSVEQGKLLDENGAAVTSGKLILREKADYKLTNGWVQLTVISNRYR